MAAAKCSPARSTARVEESLPGFAPKAIPPRICPKQSLPGFAHGKGKGAEKKKLGGQQGSGRSREGNIKLMSTTGSCEEAPGRGRDIKLMPTTRPRGGRGCQKYAHRAPGGESIKLMPSTKEARPSCSYGTSSPPPPKHLLKGGLEQGTMKFGGPIQAKGTAGNEVRPPCCQVDVHNAGKIRRAPV